MKVGDVFKVKDGFNESFWVLLESKNNVNYMFMDSCSVFHVRKEEFKNYTLVGHIETGIGTRNRFHEFVKNYISNSKKSSDVEFLVIGDMAFVKQEGNTIGAFKEGSVASIQFFPRKNKTVLKADSGEALMFIDGDQVIPFKEMVKRRYNERKNGETCLITADDTSDGIIPVDVRLDFASRMREANTLSKMHDAIYYISKIVDGIQDDYDYIQWGDPEDYK